MGGMGLRVDVSLNPTRDGGSAAPTFTPLTLAPTAWYDPSDLSSMRQGSTAGSAAAAVDSPVGYLADKSGNGNHLTQAGAGTPILRLSGGKYYLEFSSAGGLDFLSRSSNPLSGATTATAIYANAPTEATTSGLLNRWGAASDDSFEPFSAANFLSDFGSTTRPNFGNPSITLGTPYVMRLERGAANLAVTKNRVLIGSQALAVGWNAGVVYVGPNGSGSTNLYGLLVINRVLTSGEVASLEDYMAGKAGVTF